MVVKRKTATQLRTAIRVTAVFNVLAALWLSLLMFAGDRFVGRGVESVPTAAELEEAQLLNDYSKLREQAYDMRQAIRDTTNRYQFYMQTVGFLALVVVVLSGAMFSLAWRLT